MGQGQLKNKVSIVKYNGTFDSFAKVLELCNGLEGLRANDRVLLKPNIFWGGTKNFPPYGRVTTSTIVGHVLQSLKERGCDNITIGEGTILNKEMGSTTLQGFNWSGIGKVAQRYGVKVVDFNSEPYEEVNLEDVKAKISRCVLECDFLINLPVLKAHRQTQISLGMKNLKGCLSQASRKRFHTHNLHRLIALLNIKVQPSLTIIDGIYGLEKGPEFLATPHRMDLITAGKDVFSCDIVGTMLMGIKPNEVEYLKEFSSITGRAISLNEIEIVGEQIEAVTKKFDWRLSVQEIFRQARINGITIQEEGTTCCSGCMAIMSALTAVFTKDSHDTALDGVEICVGSQVKAKAGSKKVFLLGDCAISANQDLKDPVRIKGCPPPILDTVMAMVLKTLPKQKAARILMSRTVKNIGAKLGLYYEAFPVFGVYEPPTFDKKHF